MTSEEFLEKFNEGKIRYKLPSKYPENFALCKTYHDGKREVPLSHKDKVEKILKDCFAAVKPVLKKFKLSLALLIESEVTYKGVAWTRKIKVNFSNPTDKEKKEELIAYTNMIQIKIRNKDHPQNPKLFMNKTTVLAIMLHEFAHLRHMNHSIDFALFLQEIYLYAMTLGLFSENEEHTMPSSRLWERRMFETKGQMTREELDEFFKDINNNDNDDSLEHEHGEEPEKESSSANNKDQLAGANKSAESKTKAPLKSSNLKMNKIEITKGKESKVSNSSINMKKLSSTLKQEVISNVKKNSTATTVPKVTKADTASSNNSVRKTNNNKTISKSKVVLGEAKAKGKLINKEILSNEKDVINDILMTEETLNVKDAENIKDLSIKEENEGLF